MDIKNNILSKFIKAEIFAVILSLIVITVLFFIPPSVGVADNGDFERVMTSVGLDYAEDISQNYFYDYTHPILKMKSIFLWGSGSYATTHIIPVRLARIINHIFFSNQHFNMLSLAGVYSISFLIAIYLIVKYLKTNNKFINAILAVVCIWIFADATKIIYFNSLYGEACSYVALLLMLGLGLKMIRSDFKKTDIILFFISAALFFGSKLQFALLTPIIILIVIPLYKKRNTKILVSLLLGITIAISCFIYTIAPPQLAKDTLYNSVFYGIFKDSPDVNQDLKDLGLSEYMAPLSGTNAYDKIDSIDVKGEQFEKDFYNKISRSKVIFFYITHFNRLIDKMQLTASLAHDNKIGMMGNYKYEDAKSPHQLNSHFTSYNQFKKAVYPNDFWFILCFYIIYFTCIIITLIKSKNPITKNKCLLLATILLIGVAQFPLPILGNGEADIAKQLFIFNATFDIAVFAGVYAITKKFFFII